MNKKLLRHVLENIDDNGGWIWSGELSLYNNDKAKLRFERSGYSAEEYITSGIMLVESGKVIQQPRDSRFKPPQCLSVDGLDYLNALKHPRWTWFKRHAFATSIALATISLSAGSVGLNIWIQPAR